MKEMPEFPELADWMVVDHYGLDRMDRKILQVIEEYYKLYYLHKSLKINQGMLQAFNVTLLKSERDLKSGVLSMEDYNSVLVQKGKIEDTYFKTQSEYYAQYKKLQILTGINIINAK